MLLTSLRSFFFLGVFALALTAVSPVAHAADDDDPEIIAQAKEHYKAGLEAYKAAKYDVAIRELKKAYLLKRIPVLNLNIGATYRKMGDLDLALHFYQKFLDEAPSDAKDRVEVEKIIGELKAQKSAGSTDENKNNDDAPPPVRDPKRGGSGEWNHNIIDAVPPNTPIDVRVTTSVMKGVKVFVYYRGVGSADYNSVLMKRRGKEKVGRIPADAVGGRSLQYYIEAKDSAGTVVKSSGSQSNPNIMMVEDGVKPVMISSRGRRDDEPEEEPADEEEKPKKRKPTRDLDDESAPTTGHVDLSDNEPVRTPARKKEGGGLSTLQKAGIGLMAGGGGAVIGGGVLLGLAKNESNVLTQNSVGSFVDDTGKTQQIFFNNDPAVSLQDADRASRGKAYNAAGIGLAVVGGAAIAAGAGCLIADAVMKADKAHPAKKHKKKRRRVVEDDEEEETMNWYVAPSVSPTAVSVSGGFSF